jgi:hypothetical protein
MLGLCALALASAGDFNGDGKMDLLVPPIAGAPVLLENETTSQNSYWGYNCAASRAIGMRLAQP